jgi:hypothetical protein
VKSGKKEEFLTQRREDAKKKRKLGSFAARAERAWEKKQ